MTIFNLKKLLLPWTKKSPNLLISGEMQINSKEVCTGDIFIAISGYKTDGKLYIEEAISRGASAIITESNNTESKINIQFKGDIPIIYMPFLKKNLSFLSGRFYEHPSKKLNLIGITGTNGKTTIAHLITQWTNLLGESNAVMGTIGNGFLNNLEQSSNTTDSPVIIQKSLNQFIKKKAKTVSIEVSSHGIIQNRVKDLYFSAAIFTNLSKEHLDFHKNMKKYELAKWKLFNVLDVKERIINVDDEIGKKWIKKLKKSVVVSSRNNVDLKRNEHWIYAEKVIIRKDGTDIEFCSSWGNGKINSKLIGLFNVSNLLLSLATLLIIGYPLLSLLEVASFLHPVFGRMEIFKKNMSPFLLLDYAHNPDALEKALIFSKKNFVGKLWCIFGCGGNRDNRKRPIMGSIAEKYSDIVIITNDNPRYENEKKIINEILSGFLFPNLVKIIPCRTTAIKYAFFHASLEDVIIIAGKGHETFQTFENKNFYHSDRLIIINLLKNIK